MAFPPASSLNADARIIADLLASCSVGEVVSYDDMTALLGAPVKARRHIIMRALVLVNKETGAIFGNVFGLGYKRIPNQEAHLVGHHARKRVRGIGRRASAVMTRALEMANDMSDEAKKNTFAEINTLGLLQHIARDRTTAKIAELNKPAPVAHAMRAALAQMGVDV